MDPDGLSERREGDRLVLAAEGAWTIETAAAMDRRLAGVDRRGCKSVRLELSGLSALDTAGAWILQRTLAALRSEGLDAEYAGVPATYRALLERVAESGAPAPPVPTRPFAPLLFLARVGDGVFGAIFQGRDLLGFYGLVTIAMLRSLLRPGRIRFTSLVYHLEHTGVTALPIVGLLAFLIGVVLAYQGIDQLRVFGAEIFTVNLVGVATLREMGILITAIIVAGRSGSAFTAQIGTMQVNEEVDALSTIGLDPIEVLVLPRVLALMIALPLLTFFADIMALVGGGLMVLMLADLSVQQFLNQLLSAMTPTTFWVGMVKAPVFAFVIALVGCFEGLNVTGSAESVGRLTTKAVVESIFLVIVLDAAFSILFSTLGV